MGFEDLSDEDIIKIMTTDDGLNKFLERPENRKLLFGVNADSEEYIRNILKNETQLSDEEINNKIQQFDTIGKPGTFDVVVII